MPHLRAHPILAGLSSRPLLLAALMTLCSTCLQGFRFGISNNNFHVAIVLRLFDEPQFAGDAYMQSLRNYVSPIYTMLAVLATERTIEAWFFACHAITRLLTFLALLRLLSVWGLQNSGFVAAAATLALCRCIGGLSPVGADGMLINYFTHTELAQALGLHGLAFLLQGKLIPAAVMAGLAFDINAFVGFWIASAIAPSAIYFLAQVPGGAQRFAAWRQTLGAACVFCALSAAELTWIYGVTSQQSVNFNYRNFLLLYYGKHFFLSASTFADITRDVAMVGSGILALTCLRTPARHWLAFAGMVALFIAGSVLDPPTSSRLVLGLHLLRVDGMIALFVAPIAAAAAVRHIDGAKAAETFCCVGVLLGLVAGSWFVCLAFLAFQLIRLHQHNVADDRILRRPMALIQSRPGLSLMAGAGLLSAHAVWDGYFSRHYLAAQSSVPSNDDLQGARPRAPEWLEAAKWARAETPPDATFLVPTDLNGFRVAARRITSLNWKEGGAVMWAPWLYTEWLQAMRDMGGLRTTLDRMRYACRHHYAYIVEDLRDGATTLRPSQTVAYANEWFAVLPVAPCPPRAVATHNP